MSQLSKVLEPGYETYGFIGPILSPFIGITFGLILAGILRGLFYVLIGKVLPYGKTPGSIILLPIEIFARGFVEKEEQ
ncbi:MAG: hypothetical protein QXD95_09135 [Nitrososphaeria archaeon]